MRDRDFRLGGSNLDVALLLAVLIGTSLEMD